MYKRALSYDAYLEWHGNRTIVLCRTQRQRNKIKKAYHIYDD